LTNLNISWNAEAQHSSNHKPKEENNNL